MQVKKSKNSREEDIIDDIQIRANRIRYNIVKMIDIARSGHTGGSLSAVEIVASLFFGTLRLDVSKPDWEERDRFVLSKGHACPVLYATLAEMGFFPVEKLWTFRHCGSILQGHPDMTKTPGIDMTSGSLGQGLSVGIGMACAVKIRNLKSRIFVLLGDGEIQEGQVWEAAMAASHFKLDNLLAIIDHNKLQVDGPVEEIMSIEPIVDKWRSFGWTTFEVDGHNIREILTTVMKAISIKGRPAVIIAHTLKGKGVSFMEGKVEYHGSSAPSREECRLALEELSVRMELK